MPPDRPDRNAGQDDGRTEVIDVFGKEQTVVVDDATAGGEGVDLNSAGEGDARGMSFEEGGDARDSGADDRLADDRRRGRDVRRGSSDDGGGSGEGSDDAYSTRVRKRIARERTLVNRERALREQTQRELATERAARVAQDERIARLERATVEVTQNAGVKDLENQISALRPQIAAAMEAGDTAKVLDFQEKLSDLKAKLEVVKYDLHQRQKAAEAAANSRSNTATQQTDVVDEAERARAQRQSDLFWRQNRHWANRSANKAAADDVVNIDKEILADIENGDLDFGKYSDEHFEEIARRLHETYPDLEIQDLDGTPYNFDEDDMNERDTGGDTRRNGGPQGAARRAPVNRMGQGGRRAPTEVELARQGRVALDDKDRATMRLFKMDPNDPTAKKYFAKEKMRSILTGDRRAGGNR